MDATTAPSTAATASHTDVKEIAKLKEENGNNYVLEFALKFVLPRVTSPLSPQQHRIMIRYRSNVLILNTCDIQRKMYLKVKGPDDTVFVSGTKYAYQRWVNKTT